MGKRPFAAALAMLTENGAEAAAARLASGT